MASNGPCPLIVALSSTPFLAGTVTARAAPAAGLSASVLGAGIAVCPARDRRPSANVAEAALIRSSLKALVLKESSAAIVEDFPGFMQALPTAVNDRAFFHQPKSLNSLLK
jgi:hypothetical protein